MLHSKLTKKGFVNFELEITALNQLIYLNGADFIDPRSKANTLESTITKIIDLYRVALSVDSEQVHSAVAQGFMHILESWIKPKYGIDIIKIEEMLITPLELIINSGEDKIAQVGAAYCYYFLVKAAFENKYTELYDYLYAKFLKIFQVNFCI